MSKITRITLDDRGAPREIAVVLTVDEAAQITQWAGKLVPATLETKSLYNTLAGNLFNRFWDNGVEGYVHGDDVS